MKTNYKGGVSLIELNDSEQLDGFIFVRTN